MQEKLSSNATHGTHNSRTPHRLKFTVMMKLALVRHQHFRPSPRIARVSFFSHAATAATLSLGTRLQSTAAAAAAAGMAYFFSFGLFSTSFSPKAQAFSTTCA